MLIWQLFATVKAAHFASGVVPAVAFSIILIFISGNRVFRIKAFVITQISVQSPTKSTSS